MSFELVIWELESAVELARKLEAEVSKVGWHVALAGSVLHQGESTKDLDLILYPHKRTANQRPRANELRAALKRAGLRQVRTRREIKAWWKHLGSNDQKFVETWMAETGRRIDIFLLS